MGEESQGDMRCVGAVESCGKNAGYAPLGEYVKDHTIVEKDGVFHLFSISGKAGTNWLNSGSEETFSHSVSRDLSTWIFEGHVLGLGEKGSWNESKVWAPHVIEHNGLYYMFYTGVSHKGPGWNRHIESIGLAVSKDLYEWKEFPHNPIWRSPEWAVPDSVQVIAGRDPMVFRDHGYDRWVMVYTTFTDKTLNKYAVGAALSQDLYSWEDAGTLFTVPEGQHTESPFLIKRDDKYYVLLNQGMACADELFGDWPPVYAYEGLVPGYAGEVYNIGGKWYRSLVIGPKDQYRLKVYELQWNGNTVRHIEFSGL